MGAMGGNGGKVGGELSRGSWRQLIIYGCNIHLDPLYTLTFDELEKCQSLSRDYPIQESSDEGYGFDLIARRILLSISRSGDIQCKALFYIHSQF
jgi:hypothetical protein